MIHEEVKDYCWGLYGKSPAPMDPEVQKIALKGYERGEEPITVRAADMLEPELEKAKEDTKDVAKDINDVLIYALYPTTGMRFLRLKYGLDKEIPSDWKPPKAPKTLEEAKQEEELIELAKRGSWWKPKSRRSQGRRPHLNVFVAMNTIGRTKRSAARRRCRWPLPSLQRRRRHRGRRHRRPPLRRSRPAPWTSLLVRRRSQRRCRG
jgi:hypothetical protein